MNLSLKVINRRMTEDFTLQDKDIMKATVGTLKLSQRPKLTLGSLCLRTAKPHEADGSQNLADSNSSTKDEDN
jgi:hypothetical protein